MVGLTLAYFAHRKGLPLTLRSGRPDRRRHGGGDAVGAVGPRQGRAPPVRTEPVVAVCLMVFVLIAGPTAFLIKALVQNFGLYLDHFFVRTFNLYA